MLLARNFKFIFWFNLEKAKGTSAYMEAYNFDPDLFKIALLLLGIFHKLVCLQRARLENGFQIEKVGLFQVLTYIVACV